MQEAPLTKISSRHPYKNSNNKPIIHKRQLIKERCNLSTHKPTLASDSSTREITTDNSKSLQFITEPEGTY